MAYANFGEWLMAFLQKQCGFSLEDATEIKDEIVKNIEYYGQADVKEGLQKAIEEMKKKLPNVPGNPLNPTPSLPYEPFRSPWKEYTGDPPPGKETWTISTTDEIPPIWVGKYKNKLNQKE